MAISHVTTECTGESAIGAGVTNAADRAAAVKTYDDTKYVAMGGSGVGALFTINTQSISGSVDPRTKYLNFRMRALSNSGLFVIQFFPDDSPNRSQLNIDMGTLAPPIDGQFHDYSVHPTNDWDHTNANQGGCNPSMRVLWINGSPASNDALVSYMSFGDAEIMPTTTDYPVTGASSATMSGASSHVSAFLHTSAGSVTMTGAKVADITRIVPTVVPSASGSGRSPGTIVLSDDTPLPGDTITLTFQPGPGARITEVTLDGVTQSGTYAATWAALMPGVAWSHTYEVPEDVPPVISAQFTEAANGGSISYAPGGFLAGSAVEDFATRAANMEDLRKKKYEQL